MYSLVGGLLPVLTRGYPRALHGAGGREATVEHVLGTRGYSRGTARVLECAAAAARPQQPTRTHIYTRVTPTAARTCAGGRTGVQGHGMKRYSNRYSSTGTHPGYSRRSSGVLYRGSRLRRVMCYATFGCGHVTAARAWVLAWVLTGFFYAAPEYVRARCRSLQAALCL